MGLLLFKLTINYLHSSMQWKIYYTDNTTYSSEQGTPQEAPAFGVLVVVEHHEGVGRYIHTLCDWYYYHTELQEWFAGDLHGLLDHLLHNLPITAVKQGRLVDNDTYKQVLRQAMNDPDFPRKSAVHKNEKKQWYERYGEVL